MTRDQRSGYELAALLRVVNARLGRAIDVVGGRGRESGAVVFMRD
jgi:hypothetical protein